MFKKNDVVRIIVKKKQFNDMSKCPLINEKFEAHDMEGVVTRIYKVDGKTRYGIALTEVYNPFSETGVYWYTEDELEPVTTSTYPASDSNIKQVIFNDPATIVIWKDGSKTVVKCMEGERFDPEKGLAMAISKGVLGDQFQKTFRKWLPKEEEIRKLSNGTEEVKKMMIVYGKPICPHCHKLIRDMREGLPSEMYCQFCGKKYRRI